MNEEPNRRAPRWGLAIGLLVVVSGAIFGVSKWAPFTPTADPVAAAGGDADRGAVLYATACAGCHGDNGAGGGIGPTLAGVPRAPQGIAAVIAAGRGAMPGGLVSGTEAADVVAYVVSIGGGAAAPAATTATTATAPTEPIGTQEGTTTFVGNRLQGLTIRLDEPAPDGWSVWVDGPSGVRRITAIAENARAATLSDAGLGSLVDGSDTVLVGATAEAPALRAEVPAGLGELLVGSDSAPGGVGLLTGASGQIDVIRDHIRFLQRALDEQNLANIRFHGEHMVNITRGEPLKDIDGNGDASSPGDGFGLLGQPDRDGYLPRILELAGPDQSAAARLKESLRAIARDGERCGAAADVAAGQPCVEAIAARDADIAADWAGVADEVRATATTSLLSAK